MSTERMLWIWAKPNCSRKHLGEDKDVPGIYAVAINRGMTDAEDASSALDGFHETIPVDCLDNFEFIVFNSDGHVLEALDDESYTRGDLVIDLWRDEQKGMRLFTIENTQWVAKSEKRAKKMFDQYFPKGQPCNI